MWWYRLIVCTFFLGFCDNRDIKNDLGQRWLWIGKRPSNLFRVTISSLRMIGLPAPFLSYDLLSHRASFAKHINTICKACIKILRHYFKMWEVLLKIDFDIQKMIDTKLLL
jgi:hypothetical protein